MPDSHEKSGRPSRYPWLPRKWEDVAKELPDDFYVCLAWSLLVRLDRVRPKDAEWFRAELPTWADYYLSLREDLGVFDAQMMLFNLVACGNKPRVECSASIVDMHYRKGLAAFKGLPVTRAFRTGSPETALQSHAESFLGDIASKYPCRTCKRVTRLDSGFWGNIQKNFRIRSRGDFVIELLAHHHNSTYDGIDRLLKNMRKLVARVHSSSV